MSTIKKVVKKSLGESKKASIPSIVVKAKVKVKIGGKDLKKGK